MKLLALFKWRFKELSSYQIPFHMPGFQKLNIQLDTIMWFISIQILLQKQTYTATFLFTGLLESTASACTFQNVLPATTNFVWANLNFKRAMTLERPKYVENVQI